jgi:hypothetical protein
VALGRSGLVVAFRPKARQVRAPHEERGSGDVRRNETRGDRRFRGRAPHALHAIDAHALVAAFKRLASRRPWSPDTSELSPRSAQPSSGRARPTLHKRRQPGKKATMATDAPRDGASAVEFAAYVVAVETGMAERILRRHHPMPNGLCAGCLATPAEDPCQVARIAELAQQRPEYRRATGDEIASRLRELPNLSQPTRHATERDRRRV